MKIKKKHAQLNCWKLYKVLKLHVQLIFDDEKYFSLTRNTFCNRKHYTNDAFIASPEVKHKTEMKFLSGWQYLKWVFRRSKDIFK